METKEHLKQENPKGNRPDPLLIPDVAAAALVGVSKATWNRMRCSGKIPNCFRIGRKVLWRRDEIIAWVQAGLPDAKTWSAMASTKK